MFVIRRKNSAKKENKSNSFGISALNAVIIFLLMTIIISLLTSCRICKSIDDYETLLPILYEAVKEREVQGHVGDFHKPLDERLSDIQLSGPATTFDTKNQRYAKFTIENYCANEYKVVAMIDDCGNVINLSPWPNDC